MKVYQVHQELVSNPLADVAAEVRQQLASLQIEVPRGDVAITAGSRGISNIPIIIKTIGEWIKEQGAAPFIVPCMGSHNGATAAGQREMVQELGITEEAMDMPIRSSMEVVDLGTVSSGHVYMDKNCYEAAGVIVTNRIKLHTCFSGPVQSGLAKMMVVGMGKIKSATTFHSAPTPEMKNMLLEMGQVILDSGKILAGLAILEDGFDRTAELHAIRPSDILQRESQLLDKHRQYFPAIPLDDIEVLVVNEIGKTFSGTGMDTNVIGYRGVKGLHDLDRPRIKIIAALALAEASHGNAIGVGLADFITRRLRNDIDEEKTFINVFTTGEMSRGKIPATLPSDQDLVDTISSRYGHKRWMFIPNTLHLETLFVSEDLRDEIEAHPRCSIVGGAIDLPLADGQLGLAFG